MIWINIATLPRFGSWLTVSGKPGHTEPPCIPNFPPLSLAGADGRYAGADRMSLTTVEDWLTEYGESHTNTANEMIHWICVPLIALSVIGMFWSLPVPEAFVEISPIMNWGMLFMMAAVVYYFILSPSLAIGMILVISIFIAALVWMDSFSIPLWQICVAIFVLAWIGQFIGHAIEGKRPSFFKDLQFLMIGPMWLLALLYRRLGIRY